jgi:hypothetical protein
MNPETLKHKASLWEGDYGTSRHITDVQWEGDITQEELIDAADRISSEWETLDLELDPAHPLHGQVFRLKRPSQDDIEETHAFREAQALAALVGKDVWVHCCQYVYDPNGDFEEEDGQKYGKLLHTVMFSMTFISLDDVAAECDESLGADAWSEFDLYLHEELPTPVARYVCPLD